MRNLIAAFLFAMLLGQGAYAQTVPSWIQYGAVGTAAQWQQAFASKVDYSGVAPCYVNGCIMIGEVTFVSSSANNASFNIPAGVAPSIPNNGDFWETASGLFVHVNGSTYNLLTGCNVCAVTNASNIFTAGPQIIQMNAATLPTGLTGDVLQMGNTDGTISRVDMAAFGAVPVFTGRRADGTSASPTAVQSGDVLADFNAHGYYASAWTGTAAASLEMGADQNWTSSAQGTHVDIKTTPNGSTVSSLAIVCRFGNDGGITCPNTVTGGDKGPGTINATGLYVNGTAVSSGGSVTAVSGGTGITTSPNPITTTGTVSLASIATGNVLANTTGSSGAPTATAPSDILDVIGSIQGDILYRGASSWGVLAYGTSGQLLQTQGVGANPQWASLGSLLTQGTGISISGGVNPTIAISPTTGTGNVVFSASPTLSGTIGGALTFSGAQTHSSTTTLNGALTYGGVTLSNSVTGTGSMVLSASATTSGLTNSGTFTNTGTLTNSGSAVLFTGIAANPGTYPMCFTTSNGSVTYYTACTSSDMRLKTHFAAAPGLIDILRLKPISFDWLDAEQAQRDGRQIGLLAQDVEQVLPQVVSTSDAVRTITLADGERREIDHVKSLSYEKLVVPLIGAVKTLAAICLILFLMILTLAYRQMRMGRRHRAFA